MVLEPESPVSWVNALTAQMLELTQEITVSFSHGTYARYMHVCNSIPVHSLMSMLNNKLCISAKNTTYAARTPLFGREKGNGNWSNSCPVPL